MNGDLQTIYNAVQGINSRLDVLETKQEERHNFNVPKMEKLDNLPCNAHVERIKDNEGKLTWLMGIIAVILAGVILAMIRHFVVN